MKEKNRVCGELAIVYSVILYSKQVTTQSNPGRFRPQPPFHTNVLVIIVSARTRDAVLFGRSSKESHGCYSQDD